jgi:LPXTG-site transpeptidase (sortase) family protein
VLVLLGIVLAPSAPAALPSPATASSTERWAEAWAETWSGSRSARPEAAERSYVAGVPVTLTIPRLGVDTDVVAVAAVSGVLVPPADPDLVGWWSGGVRPGSREGAALMTGHTVRGGDGVFDDLAAMAPGDLVEVVTRRASVAYVVVSVRDLSKTELAEAAVDLFAASGRPRLVLVTCTDWEAGRYLGNTVVVAVPGEPQQR